MLEKAIEYGIGILGLQDLCLDICYEKGMAVCGEILIDDESCEIYIDSSLPVKTMVITILHELYHAYQWKHKKPLCDDEAYEKEKILYDDFLLTLVVN